MRNWKLLILIIVGLFIAGFAAAGTFTKGTISKNDVNPWDGATATFTRSTSTGYSLTLNKFDWIGVDVFEAYGGGVNRNSTTIADAITGVGANNAELWFSPGTWSITQNHTFAATSLVKMPKGAVFDTDISIRSATYKWTASGGGVNEYYLELAGGGNPGINQPSVVAENDSAMTAGVIGALAAGEWNWGNNDALGYNTIYVRLSDGDDPDNKAADYVEAGYTLTINLFEAGIYQAFNGNGTVSFGAGAVEKVYPEWFGVTADGTTDDTAAFQRFITSIPTDGIARMPNGTIILFNITGVSDMKIIGNKESSILKHKAAATDHMLECSGDVEFDGVQIDGNKANQTGQYAAIFFSGTRFTANNCIFTGTVGDSIYLYACLKANITYNEFLDLDEHSGTAAHHAFGIYMPAAASDVYLNIHGNKFINSAPVDNTKAPCGIFLSGSEGSGVIQATITDNYFNHFGTDHATSARGCIDIYRSADRCIITGNRFENFHYTPIKCSDSNELVITSNIIKTPGHDFASASIVVQGKSQDAAESHDMIISNNIIDNKYGTAISVTVAAGATTDRRIIIGNDILACSRGIYLYRMAEGAIVQGNMIDATYCATYTIEITTSSGEFNISGNVIRNLLAGIGIWARTSVTTANFIINGNSIQSDGTATYHLSIQDAASCVCNGNRMVGDDPPVDFANVTPLTLVGNQSDNLSPSFGAGLTTKINYGNSWDFLQASDTWDPGNIGVGAMEAKAVTVTGAALGDYATASFSLDLADLVLDAKVTAANTVTCVLSNNTGGAVDLASGTIYVKVNRR